MKYIIWHADLERESQTKKDYSSEHSVSLTQLWRYEQMPGFWEEVDKIRLEFMKGLTTDVIKAVYRDSLGGKAKQQEIFLTMSGHYVKKSEVKQTGRTEFVMTDDDEKEVDDALDGMDV